MLLVITIFIAILDFIMGCLKKKSRLLVVVNFFITWIIISGYFSGVDIDNYRYDYFILTYGGKSMFSDLGYVLLCKLFIGFGIDFFMFKKIVVFICLTLVFYSIKRMNGNILMIMSYYLIYQSVFDAIQFRNFIGFSILMVAYIFLMENTKKSKFIYLTLILLSSLFHSVMIVYCIYLLIDDDKLSIKLRNIIIIFSIILTLFTFVNGKSIPLISNFFMSDNNMNIYLSSSGDSLAFILPITILSIFIFFERYLIKMKRLNNFNTKVFNIDLLTCIFIPLFIVSFQWYRILRNIVVLNEISFSNEIDKLPFGSKLRNNIIIAFLLIIIIFYYSDVVRFLLVDNYLTVFKNNVFITDNIFTNLFY